MYKMGNFRFTVRLYLPFIEATGEDETAMVFICRSKGRFFGQGFSPGIDHSAADGWILSPGRDQTPDEETSFFRPIVGQGQDGLGWGNVISRSILGREFEIGEGILQVDGINGQGKSSAHSEFLSAVVGSFF
jgi:hypothetical protein